MDSLAIFFFFETSVRVKVMLPVVFPHLSYPTRMYVCCMYVSMRAYVGKSGACANDQHVGYIVQIRRRMSSALTKLIPVNTNVLRSGSPVDGLEPTPSELALASSPDNMPGNARTKGSTRLPSSTTLSPSLSSTTLSQRTSVYVEHS
jgi:hypothetical protein